MYHLGTVIVVGWKYTGAGLAYPYEEFSNFTYDRMFVISESLALADVSDNPDNVIPIIDEAARVFAHAAKADSARSYYQAPPSSPHSATLEFVKRTASRVTYACFDEKLASSGYELAALVKTETLQDRLWGILRRHAKAVKASFYFLPDIFTGPDNLAYAKSLIPPHERSKLKGLIELGINHLRMFLAVGYHLRENRAPVDGWALQIASPWLSLVVSLNRIVPGYVDSDVSRELFESSAMRKLVCDKTLCALSNYFVFAYDGEKITADDLFEALSSAGDDAGQDDATAWSSPALWRKIYTRYVTHEYV